MISKLYQFTYLGQAAALFHVSPHPATATALRITQSGAPDSPWTIPIKQGACYWVKAVLNTNPFILEWVNGSTILETTTNSTAYVGSSGGASSADYFLADTFYSQSPLCFAGAPLSTTTGYGSRPKANSSFWEGANFGVGLSAGGLGQSVLTYFPSTLNAVSGNSYSATILRSEQINTATTDLSRWGPPIGQYLNGSLNASFTSGLSAIPLPSTGTIYHLKTSFAVTQVQFISSGGN